MTGSRLTLFSLVSRQVWPHVLAVAHLKPKRLVLLHTDDREESRRPAERLRKYFDVRSELLAERPLLERVPHDDFEEVSRRLDALVETIEDDEVVLNFTGGNKLMATAAFRWAERAGKRAVYLERGNRLTWFEPVDGKLRLRSEKIDGGITNGEDPLALLRCQLSASEVDRDGEELTLSERGASLPEEGFFREVDGGDAASLIATGDSVGSGKPKEGDRLERAAAAVALKLGVRRVRRSVELKTNLPAKRAMTHAEIDLLFNWNGRLWIVDCKDRVSEESLVARLWKQLSSARVPKGANEIIRRIESELRASATKVLKEDLVAIDDTAGLQGQIVCVRREPLPDHAIEYAKGTGIEVILKSELSDGFRRLLYPDRPARPEAMAKLASQFPKR